MVCERIIAWLCGLLVVLGLSGCAAERAYQAGNELTAQDQVTAGLLKYQEAVAADPGNPVYRAAFLRTRDGATTRLLQQADRAFADGKPGLAQEDYLRVLAIDPLNDRGRAGLRLIETDRRHAQMLQAASEAFKNNDYAVARQKLSEILTERPNHEAARQLLAQVEEKTTQRPSETALSDAFHKAVSLEFRDAPLRQIFEAIARHAGLNFVFDKDIKTDIRSSIFLKNSTVEAAIYDLLMTNQLELQVMDGNTILIYPNTPAKLKEYQELTVKTFFVANADAKSVASTIKTILKTPDVVVDDKLNLVIMRDSPEAIRLASQIVALQDVPEPEVMLDVEVLEIQRSRLLDLGVQWPKTLAFAPLQTANGTALTIDQLRGLNRSSIGVSGLSAALYANKTDSDTNTLANPRIRVRNKEKAKVVIGDKLPTFTTTVSPGVGGFASESINYVDVGLTLNVEPTIYLNNEVAIRISLEVSNLIDTVTTKSGAVAYHIGNRSASTLLQLKDGENQVLAGLIKSEDRSSADKLPGVGSLPVLGRLFGSGADSNDKTEVVLSITPHLVRNIQRPPASLSEFRAGTGASFRQRPDTAPRQPVMLPVRQQKTTAGQAAGNRVVTVAPPSQPASVPSELSGKAPAANVPAEPAGSTAASANTMGASTEVRKQP